MYLFVYWSIHCILPRRHHTLYVWYRPKYSGSVSSIVHLPDSLFLVDASLETPHISLPHRLLTCSKRVKRSPFPLSSRRGENIPGSFLASLGPVFRGSQRPPALGIARTCRYEQPAVQAVRCHIPPTSSLYIPHYTFHTSPGQGKNKNKY